MKKATVLHLILGFPVFLYCLYFRYVIFQVPGDEERAFRR